MSIDREIRPDTRAAELVDYIGTTRREMVHLWSVIEGHMTRGDQLDAVDLEEFARHAEQLNRLAWLLTEAASAPR